MAKIKSRKKRFRYFYINSELHKVLRVNRAEDMVFAWNYPNGKRVAYVWSDVQKNMQHAYRIPQVGEMLHRHPNIIKSYVKSGNIKPIQKTYTLDENKSPGIFLFSEDNVKELHEYLLTVHRGRPRKDGEIVSSNLPTKAELNAMLKQETILYMKTKDGDFSPVWKQPDW